MKKTAAPAEIAAQETLLPKKSKFQIWCKNMKGKLSVPDFPVSCHTHRIPVQLPAHLRCSDRLPGLYAR